jgi:hypothetical protein
VDKAESGTAVIVFQFFVLRNSTLEYSYLAVVHFATLTHKTIFALLNKHKMALSEQENIRREKLQALRNLGINLIQLIFSCKSILRSR